MKSTVTRYWWALGVPLFSIIHGLCVYSLFSLLITWGYGNNPPADWVAMLIRSAFLILDPLAFVVGYLDNNWVRLPDCWYYLSEMACAVIWATLIVLLLQKRLGDTTCNSNQRGHGTR